jgi:hypothetical protein
VPLEKVVPPCSHIIHLGFHSPPFQSIFHSIFSLAPQPSAHSYKIINVFTAIKGTAPTLSSATDLILHQTVMQSWKGYILRINVRTLVIRFINLLFTLASPPLLPPPNPGSDTVFDHPTVTELLVVFLGLRADERGE